MSKHSKYEPYYSPAFSDVISSRNLKVLSECRLLIRKAQAKELIKTGKRTNQLEILRKILKKAAR